MSLRRLHVRLGGPARPASAGRRALGGMTPKLGDYIEAGKALEVDERLEAPHQLLLSVDRDVEASENEIASAWEESIDRRVAAIVSAEAAIVYGREAHGPRPRRDRRFSPVTSTWREQAGALDEYRAAAQ